VNHHQIPVNAPMPVPQLPPRRRHARPPNDGGSTPTSRTAAASGRSSPQYKEPPLALEGAADHWNHRVDTDYYSQPGALFRLLTAEEEQHCSKTPHAPSRRVEGSAAAPHRQLHPGRSGLRVAPASPPPSRRSKASKHD
jgi:catalase